MFLYISPIEQNKNFVQLGVLKCANLCAIMDISMKCGDTMTREDILNMPALVREFASYMNTINDKSQGTINEYLLDLRTFFKFMKVLFGLCECPDMNDLSNVDISDIDIDFIKKIKLTDVYEYFDYLSTQRKKFHNSELSDYGLSPATRARKVSSLRTFYKYLQKTGKITENPMADLEFPKSRSKLPHYLTYDESISLLENITGEYKTRDFCIIMLFLNCGLRVSELTGINLGDIKEELLRVLGKGGKERVVYLNEACQAAISDYILERNKIRNINQKDQKALFISRNGNRISTSTVKWLVKKYCSYAGLDSKISVHKLRHTSATLMYKNGVDVKALQEVLGHQHLNTTEIYTHADSETLRGAAMANPLSRYKHQKNKD